MIDRYYLDSESLLEITRGNILKMQKKNKYSLYSYKFLWVGTEITEIIYIDVTKCSIFFVLTIIVMFISYNKLSSKLFFSFTLFFNLIYPLPISYPSKQNASTLMATLFF